MAQKHAVALKKRGKKAAMMDEMSKDMVGMMYEKPAAKKARKGQQKKAAKKGY